jgi:hypothetical protein
MGWLAEVFFQLGALVVWVTTVPVVIGGALMGLAGAKIRRKRQRAAVLAGIVVVQAMASFIHWFLPTGGTVSENLVLLFSPLRFDYPFLNIWSLLFFWVPVLGEFVYVIRRPIPRPWLPPLIGLGLLCLGAAFFLGVGSLVGAQAD